MEDTLLVYNQIRYFSDVSYFYTIVGIISFITIVLVSNRVRSTKYKDILDKPFVWLLRFFMLFCIVDASWGIFAFLSHPDLEIFAKIPFIKYVYIFLTYMFHGLAALSAFMWSGYIVNYLDPPAKSKNIMSGFRIALFVIQIVCLVLNTFIEEKWRAFFFDVNGVYQSSNFRDSLFYLQFLHYFMILVFSIIYIYKDRSKESINRAKFAIVFSAVPFIMGIGQMRAPDLAFYSLGFMLSSIVIYIFNITTQREKYLTDILQLNITTEKMKAREEMLENNKDELKKEVESRVKEIEEQNAKILRLQNHTIIALSMLVENRDLETGNHVVRTTEYVKYISRLALESGRFPELTPHTIDYFAKAAPLHDVGKIIVPDTVLKKPGRLTDEEFAQIKLHTTEGGRIIKDIFGKEADSDYLQIAYDIATYHHEKYNGQGYPKGLVGEEIPLAARIVAVADVFDALVSVRCYKQAMSVEDAFGIIKKDCGIHFDPIIAGLFISHKEGILEIMEKYKD